MACEVELFTPQSEYRPTEYLQGWLSFWFDDAKRLAAAKRFQNARIEFLQCVWRADRKLILEKFNLQDEVIKQSLETFHQRTEVAIKPAVLLLTEALLTKALYKYAANNTGKEGFSHQHQPDKKYTDKVFTAAQAA